MGAVFSVTPLLSGGYVVDGEDAVGVKGSTTLKSEAWDAYNYIQSQTKAVEEFDKAVRKFFKPLTKAADKLRVSDENPYATVTIGEDVEGTETTTIELDEAGILLNILDQGEFDVLRWVDGKLVAVK